MYRKGVDLLTGIIPFICRVHEHVDFLIGGNGPKLLQIQEMIEREQLQGRVILLGAVPHVSVRDVLIKGHIFLNCSLTESFCIALLEAASCGLFCVSTNVGGVPEILPEDMIYLADPNATSLGNALSQAIRVEIIEKTMEENGGGTSDLKVVDDKIEGKKNLSQTVYIMKNDPYLFHERMKKMYSWMKVAKKTVNVYDKIEKLPQLNFLERLQLYRTAGKYLGLLVCGIFMLIHFWVKIVELLLPRDSIDIVPDLNESNTTAKYDKKESLKQS